jgi:glycosyltransferase involved in cell wall biosynthesis
MVEHIARTNETFPKDPLLRNARLRIEALAAQRARRLVFCTDAARAIVADRYQNLTQDQLVVISNGYEEDAFRQIAPTTATGSTRRVLVHSGTIYLGSDRDPTALFNAIRRLANAGALTPQNFELRLRDPSGEARLKQIITDAGLDSLVKIYPSLPYVQALGEMLSADGLLLLQGYTSNPAVPAKLYEYARAHRPILGLVDAQGETAATLRALAIDATADITDADAIASLLERWIAARPESGFGLPDRNVVERYSRRALTARLADVLNALV